MSCPDCFKGSVHNHGSPQGTWEEIHGYLTYVAGGSSPSPKSTIIFLPDAFSLKLVNNKILADRYARETGFRVLIPDIIPGGGADVAAMYHAENIMRPGGWLNPFRWASRFFSLVKAIYYMVPFVIKANPAKVLPAIVKYTRGVRQDLPPGAKLGAAGFCWGGYGATNLCVERVKEGETPTTPGSKPLIDAVFTAHPSSLKTPDMFIDAIGKGKVPYSCAIAETDFMVDAKLAEKVEVVLREKVGAPEQNNYEIVIHRGCKHGFAVRANPDVKNDAKGMEAATVQAVQWFKKYL